MVKGISRQVIVVSAPDEKLFEQAIFILKDDAVDSGGVTDEQLLKEASRLFRSNGQRKKRKPVLSGPVWAAGGSLLTAAVWAVIQLL